MWSRPGAVALAVLCLLPLDAAAQAIESDGAAALGVALRRLGTTKRVLMIGAHPDDENTALIAELALGDGADVAYLSLTRGEGGQNLIGPELQEGLGLIRSEELLAARRLDGARQFFTRAYDYGFSKSADEAFTQWPRDSLLADVVEVVRRYRPDIIVSVFGGTSADGHGQHQAAGIMARAAFEAAADPARYPAQLARGLTPHAPAYLFHAMYRPPQDPPLRLATGELDALFGRSRFQIAMQSRSRHRSQDMGRSEPIGPQSTALTVLGGSYPADARTLFAQLDTTLSQHATTAGASVDIVGRLESYERRVAAVRGSFNPLRRAALAPALAQAVATLDTVIALLDDAPQSGELRRRVTAEREQAADALGLDAGVVVDVVADTPTPVPGTSFDLTVTVWNGGPRPVSLERITPLLPPGWTYTGPDDHGVGLDPDRVVRRTFRVSVPRDAARTEPYFLREERSRALYSWRPVADSLRGAPFEPAAVSVAVELDVGVRLAVTRPAEFLAVDKALGEVRRPLIVVPAASVAVEPRVAAIPAGNVAPRPVSVTVRAGRADVSGSLRLDVPAGWRADPASVHIALAHAGESRTVRFDVTPAANATGEFVIRARFRSGDRTYDDGYTVIDYPHIRPHALYAPAEVRAAVFPVAIAEDLRIGYIEGAGDDGAEALRQLGATVEPLDAAALANGDLSRYHAIIAGIRAYEVRPDLIASNARLLAYARSGGTFVVQYNKYELVDGDFMPFPATMSRPHGRVTDESARVTLLAPDHPLLSYPNRIGPSDFEGWVQERGLYFLDTFADAYDAVLSMADPGEPEQRGALVAARLGRGWYVYTGLALFRQLPEAVPGAYRLLANLASLGRTEHERAGPP
ncbi:MAG TPA: PIG-L family deacetylase [Longimicrobiales bacterium]